MPDAGANARWPRQTFHGRECWRNAKPKPYNRHFARIATLLFLQFAVMHVAREFNLMFLKDFIFTPLLRHYRKVRDN